MSEQEGVMTREEAIKYIENLYPADSQNEVTAETGRLLLQQAKRDVEGWRSESDAVLIRYAQLCIYQEGKTWM